DGTFEAQWTPLPADFVGDHGREFMRKEFETPSAWATAVCRVMRAQQRAREGEARKGHLPSTGGAGESRVAVNGWTACRVRIPKDDCNRELAVKLDMEMRGTRGRKVDRVEGDIEVSLDLLRKELGLRAAASAGASSSSSSNTAAADNKDDSPESVDAPDDQPEDSEILGAVDGLAERVQSELALGFVGQRRAAAAAAGAIAASVNPMTISALKKLASSAKTAPAVSSGKPHVHSRKRKSIPDMSRHAKLSRVPTENSDSDDADDMVVSDAEDDHRAPVLGEETRLQLQYFRDKARALKRPQSELKALQYQRRQQLKQRIADSIEDWVQQRRTARAADRDKLMRGPAALPPGTRPSSAQSLRTGSLEPTGAMPVPADGHSDASLFASMRPAASDTLLSSTNDLSLRVAKIWVPPEAVDCSAVELFGMCVQCASSGNDLLACCGCGDRYHGFCVQPLQTGCRRFLCPACRVCCACLDDNVGDDDLLQCDDCGLLMHARCSRQEADHPLGLAGLVVDSEGYWVCDRCIRCLECGFTMHSRHGATANNDRRDASDDADGSSGNDDADDEDFEDRARWAYDFTLCGECAPQIEKAKVCPECIATYTNSSKSANLVCCDICSCWVHTDCDARLTPDVYDALITLEDDAPYVCPNCATMDADGKVLSGLLDDSRWTQTLPQCLARAETDSDKQEAAEPLCVSDVKPAVQQIETEEIANMLLSLTHSDVRFGRERFDVSALESHFCVPSKRALDGKGDWRQCTLCGLHGDGLVTSLGRLVPLSSSPSPSSYSSADDSEASARWAHIECLAWAWGPRTIGISDPDSLLTMVRFDGSLLDTGQDWVDLGCALCGRPGASFHCCAPTPCYDAAYHLPCLLLAGCPTPARAAEDPSYCAGWRRALCPGHAPAFASMMPAEGSVESASYSDVRVEGCITNLPELGRPPMSVKKIANLLLVADSSNANATRLSRVFRLAGRLYTVHIRVFSDAAAAGKPSLQGAIQPGPPSAKPISYTHTAASIEDLLRALMSESLPQGPKQSFLAALAYRSPFRFLKIPPRPDITAAAI
ncbi:hypothetical protein LPJ56_002828, partial [Coemansia sp. RSA 2599]